MIYKMGNVGEGMDFLFKACCLSGIIFRVIASLSYMPLKKTLYKPLNCSQIWSWYTSLLRKEHPAFDDRHLLVLFSVYRFCVIGFVTCLALAFLLIIFGVLLKISWYLALR